MGSNYTHVHNKQLARELTEIDLDTQTTKAIQTDRLVDITTVGRRSGNKSRKEVRLRQLDGQPYLSNNPGTRDWAANLFANPEFTYHLKESVQRDLRAWAVAIKDIDEKRMLLSQILEKEDALDQVEARVAGSHLFRVDIVD